MAKAIVTTGSELLKNEVIEKRSAKYLSESEKQIKRALVIQEDISFHNDKIKELKNELSDIESFFSATLKHGETLETKFGNVKKKVTNSYSLIATKLDALKAIFKRNYKNYVQTTEKYAPTNDLKKILNDPKHEHQVKVAECFSVATSTSVEFSEPKKAKAKK